MSVSAVRFAPCPDCGGRGRRTNPVWHDDYPCGRCGGTGNVGTLASPTPRRITDGQPSRPSIDTMIAELRRLAGEAFAAGDDARATRLRAAADAVAECEVSP